MEDLIGLIFIILFAALNFLSQSGKKKKQRQSPANDPQPRRPSRSLEDFFEEIARKFEPQPRELPAWPEEIERPDYMKEMVEYTTAQKSPPREESARHASTGPAEPAADPGNNEPARMVPRKPKAMSHMVPIKMASQGSVLSGMGNMRIPTPPLLGSAGGRIQFDLQSRKKLKQALIASMVFGPPRAVDTSFSNTLYK